MKMICTLITTLLLSQYAFAEVKMWYGSDHYSKTFNNQCSYDINIPVLKSNTSEFNAGIEALNSKWKTEAYEIMGSFEETIKDKEMCSEETRAYDQTNLTFEIMTPLGSKFVSIVSTTYYYGGGAHGNSGREAVVFNSENGKVYASMDSILKDSAMDAFKKKVESELISKLEVDPSFGWNDVKASWNSMADIKNFYLTDNGIVIYFDAYAVNSYAAGPQDVEIYWYDLMEMGVTDNDLVQFMSSKY